MGVTPRSPAVCLLSAVTEFLPIDSIVADSRKMIDRLNVASGAQEEFFSNYTLGMIVLSGVSDKLKKPAAFAAGFFPRRETRFARAALG